VSGVDHALTQEITGRLRAAGFALVGVCEARPIDRPAHFESWLQAGHAGQMAYLAEHLAARIDPGVLVPGARSIVCVADRYHDGRREAAWQGGEPSGRIARYARGRDYHAVMRERLEPLAEELRDRHAGERFRICVDTAPLAERDHAVRAGLGRVGKHTLLIGEGGAGSWLVLGAIVTTVRLAASSPATGDPCGACTRCIDACPTRAIEPWKVRADRCISYLTIEHAGEPAEWFRDRGDDWLFGCDACIEACPHSQPTVRSRDLGAHPAYQSAHARLSLAQVLQWNASSAQALGFSEVLRRAPLESWKRNALLLLAGMQRRSSEARDLLRGFALDAEQPASLRELCRTLLEQAPQRPGAG
jgi:epoxyqueuosine reductase